MSVKDRKLDVSTGDGLSSSEKITAILPMRSGSKRVPGKNTRMLAGKPLFLWMLETLENLPWIHEVLISTDDPKVGSVLQHRQNQTVVRLISRPKRLAEDHSSMLDVIKHTLKFVETDAIVQVHPTSPLISGTTLTHAASVFLKNANPLGKSLMGVSSFEGRLWRKDGVAVNHHPDTLLPTQDMEKLLLDCSAFYFFTKKNFLEHNNRTYGPPAFQDIHPLEAWDIDYEWQFDVAEKILEGRRL